MQDIRAFDNYKTMKIIYSMHRSGEVSIHRVCCERATQHHSLGGGGNIYPGSRPTGVITRSPRMVTECLPTRSMLKCIYHFVVCACICTLYLQSVNFMQMLTQSSPPLKVRVHFERSSPLRSQSERRLLNDLKFALDNKPIRSLEFSFFQ